MTVIVELQCYSSNFYIICYYYSLIAAHDRAGYPIREADCDLGSDTPRCSLHWRYICGFCGRSAHFMAMAFCPDKKAYFCSSCTLAREIVNEPFLVWDYFFRYQSPSTGTWHPSLDKLDYDGRHPGRSAADEIPGLSEQRSLAGTARAEQSRARHIALRMSKMRGILMRRVGMPDLARTETLLDVISVMRACCVCSVVQRGAPYWNSDVATDIYVTDWLEGERW
jgi:hypothetical protein